VPMTLAMHHIPVCVTFAFFEDSSAPVLDPSHLETQLATTTIHLALNAQQELCVVHKAGGMPLTVPEIMRCVSIANERAKALTGLMNHRLEDDWKTRIVEIR